MKIVTIILNLLIVWANLFCAIRNIINPPIEPLTLSLNLLGAVFLFVLTILLIEKL